MTLSGDPVLAIIVVPERVGGEAAIYALTEAAFEGQPHAGGNEHDVIDRLRERGQLWLSLVAKDGEELVGQVTFSLVTLSDGSSPWFGLGPVSVLPSRQCEGIGTQLILAGLDKITKEGALGCVLTGNPVYYRRFGFKLAPANVPSRESADYFQLKLLGAGQAKGCFAFHSAFYSVFPE